MIYFLRLKGCSCQCPGCQSSHGCCANIVTMLQIATILLWHSWHRDTGQVASKHPWHSVFRQNWPEYHYFHYSSDTFVRCNNSHFLTFDCGLASRASSFRLKQFVGIFTIFLVWVLQRSLGLSKWERTSCVSSWDIHPLSSLFDSCSEWCHHYPGVSLLS